ncbi:MAG: sugar kinase [Anaerolineae bacterium]|nr:sugar kinase [Anaerolineae bacterium]
MKKVICMGEMMLRLMPSGNLRIEQATAFDAYYGGDEAIVATTLARFGVPVAYVTKLPDNPLGRAALNAIRSHGVSTEFISFGGERLGLNFYENGASIRPSRVVYDRKHSAIAEAELTDFDFETIFSDAGWFHVSGITPALSDKTAAITQHALLTAKKHGVTVSVDLNYRRKLWPPDKARQVMTSLMQYVDVCIGNEEDAEIMLGFKPSNTDVFKGELNIEGYKDVFLQMKECFGFGYIATTLRQSHSASDNGWSVLVYDGKEFCHSREYQIHLVDRGGGGASFSAGLIYGLVTGKSLRETTEFAAAASALKQTISGDFNLVTVEEVMELVKGDVSGRVQR